MTNDQDYRIQAEYIHRQTVIQTDRQGCMQTVTTSKVAGTSTCVCLITPYIRKLSVILG